MAEREKVTKEAPLILASTSPRRREIMKGLDVEVEFIGPGIEEPPPSVGESPVEYVRRLSFEKAQEVARNNTGRIVVGADTTVALGNESLAKPSSEAEAIEMLNRLRGTEHFVISGITVMNSETGGWKTTDKSTRIVLRRYSDDEIARYVATGDCMDKAGGYAVQDEKFKPASIVQGCYLNAVGFPLCKVTELLAAFGVRTKVRPEWKFPSRFDGCSALKGRGANGR